MKTNSSIFRERERERRKVPYDIERETERTMKHIFKKLHHPNRSNDAQSALSAVSSSSSPAAGVSSSSSPSCTTDHPNSSSVAQSPSSPSTISTASTPTAAVPVTAGGGGNISTINRQQDYYTSEEEYQVQLALALSVSSSQSQDPFPSDVNSSNAQILCGGRSPVDLARDREDAAADLLSRQYWVNFEFSLLLKLLPFNFTLLIKLVVLLNLLFEISASSSENISLYAVFMPFCSVTLVQHFEL